VLAASAILVNPFGIAVWTFPRTLLQRISGEEEAFASIAEFASPWSSPGDPALRIFWVLAALVPAVLAAALTSGAKRAKRLRGAASALAVVLPFLALAFFARRNVPLFAIAFAPFLACTADVAQDARSRPRGRRAGDCRRRPSRSISVDSRPLARSRARSGAWALP
jgi:hypothetical protein